MALALALFTYNKGLPFSIRSAFFPILGERVWGWWGHVIDILAVFSTLFGLATALGLGAQQANAGMNFVFDIDISTTFQVIVILLVTAVALVSVWRGLEGGVKKLSEINMFVAVLFFIFVLFAGPTLVGLRGFWSGLSSYVTEFIPLSAPFGRDDDAYRQAWSVFYWAWWVSWAPPPAPREGLSQTPVGTRKTEKRPAAAAAWRSVPRPACLKFRQAMAAMPALAT